MRGWSERNKTGERKARCQMRLKQRERKKGMEWRGQEGTSEANKGIKYKGPPCLYTLHPLLEI